LGCAPKPICGRPIDTLPRILHIKCRAVLGVDGAQLRRFLQSREGGEFCHVAFVGAAGFGVGDIGEPFEFGANVGELLEHHLPRAV
jgi:hypothetical protein